jgi:hypothetical protein
VDNDARVLPSLVSIMVCQCLTASRYRTLFSTVQYVLRWVIAAAYNDGCVLLYVIFSQALQSLLSTVTRRRLRDVSSTSHGLKRTT